ncbi:hypothetical protein CLV51_103745 [Chitinophaga niastensis]|uniref:Uncharacterized protein n=1 Tax=Chitinophaga niastensis TaxID=536980 RepID=A0A2P8HKL8_CHINA|nr:hypothetical protein CLV51_103745 [Chitinophaga niastensis]
MQLYMRNIFTSDTIGNGYTKYKINSHAPPCQEENFAARMKGDKKR